MAAKSPIDRLTHSAPRLSIIVATRNAKHTLARCLKSVVEQKFQGWELLVADCLSNDGTLDIVDRYATHIRWWESRKDNGIYDAWNSALINASGQYVAFLGADDALHSNDALGRIFDGIGDGEPYDLVSSRCIIRDPDWAPIATAGGAWNYSTLPRRMSVVHPGLLHKRDLFSRYGTFDAGLRIVGDLDFLLRLPESIRTLDLPFVTVDIQNDGVSRGDVWDRLRERKLVHERCKRVGPAKAWFYWLDKAWRVPVARALGLQH